MDDEPMFQEMKEYKIDAPKNNFGKKIASEAVTECIVGSYVKIGIDCIDWNFFLQTVSEHQSYIQVLIFFVRDILKGCKQLFMLIKLFWWQAFIKYSAWEALKCIWLGWFKFFLWAFATCHFTSDTLLTFYCSCISYWNSFLVCNFYFWTCLLYLWNRYISLYLNLDFQDIEFFQWFKKRYFCKNLVLKTLINIDNSSFMWRLIHSVSAMVCSLSQKVFYWCLKRSFET